MARKRSPGRSPIGPKKSPLWPLAAAVALLLSATGATPAVMELRNSTTTVASGWIGTRTTPTVSSAGVQQLSCPPSGPCNLEGLSYVNTTGLVIATDGDLPEGVIPEPAAGSAGLVAYNASDDQFDYFAPLSCVPMEPYYPGFGETVWTGCLNSTWKWSSSIIGFNVQSKTVVANISCPFYAWDMTFDTATGQFVVAGYTESGSASAPNFGEFYANSSSMASYALPAISLQNWDGYVGSEMTFDPRTDVILAPSNGTALLAINAASPATVPATQLPGPAVASVLDPALNVVLVATESPAALVEINETTYATEGMYTSPLCGGSDCGPANDILLVPALGDVVLSAVAYLLVVHVDTLSLIGTVESGTFEGPSSVFLPHDDQVLSTWSIYLPGYPLFLSQLEFGNSTSLTTLLWLPSSLGVLLVAGFLGAAIGITLTASRSRNRVQ